MKPSTPGRGGRFRSFCSTLGSYVTLCLSLLLAMITLEFLWTGELSGLSVYVVVSLVFICVLSLLKCGKETPKITGRLRRERIK